MVWIEVPAVHKPWYWNFFLHWTFLLEVVVVVWAAVVFYRRRRVGGGRGES